MDSLFHNQLERFVSFQAIDLTQIDSRQKIIGRECCSLIDPTTPHQLTIYRIDAHKPLCRQMQQFSPLYRIGIDGKVFTPDSFNACRGIASIHLKLGHRGRFSFNILARYLEFHVTGLNRIYRHRFIILVQTRGDESPPFVSIGHIVFIEIGTLGSHIDIIPVNLSRVVYLKGIHLVDILQIDDAIVTVGRRLIECPMIFGIGGNTVEQVTGIGVERSGIRRLQESLAHAEYRTHRYVRHFRQSEAPWKI